ncbi:transposase [Sandaracinus amylolyticus]
MCRLTRLTIAVPRDREGSFEPKVVPKHQRRLEAPHDVPRSSP